MVSEKNTKQEILAEYKALLEDIKNKGLTVPPSAKGFNTKNNKSDIISAISKLLDVLNNNSTPKNEDTSNTSNTDDDTSTKEIKTVKTSPNKKEDNDLSYLNQDIIDKIQALNDAKALKKAEYNNILDIERELTNFVTMINSYKNKGIIQAENHKNAKLQQEESIAQLIENSNANNQAKLDLANEKLAELEANILKDKETLIKQREKEEEEYTYKINKSQKECDDTWSDEVAKREETIANVEVEIATLQAEIDSKQSLVAELNAKIEEIPALLEQAKLEGASEKEKELGKDYGYKTTMAKKDADATIQSLQKQIENLKEDYNTILAEKQDIQEKLDKAYEDSNKLYMQTVQSTGGVKILNNSDKN